MDHEGAGGFTKDVEMIKDQDLVEYLDNIV